MHSEASQALDTTFPCFQSPINMTNVTMAQSNHTHGLRKFGTCAGTGRKMSWRGRAWLNLDFQAEVSVEVEKTSSQTVEWKVTVEGTKGSESSPVCPKDRYQLGLCENRFLRATFPQ